MTTATAATAPTDIRTEIVENPGGGITEYTWFSPDPETMGRLTDALFKEFWNKIVVGPCVEGAVFEIRFQEAPKVTFSDGYLTVDLGYWHFHLCTGVHKRAGSEELAKNRQVSKVAFFESKRERCGGGQSWGLRMWNGFGEQLTTVFLPNAYLTDEMKIQKEPDWNRLALWHELRNRFLGEAIPADLPAHYAHLPKDTFRH